MYIWSEQCVPCSKMQPSLPDMVRAVASTSAIMPYNLRSREDELDELKLEPEANEPLAKWEEV